MPHRLPILLVLLLAAPVLHADCVPIATDGSPEEVLSDAAQEAESTGHARARRKVHTTGSRVGFRYDLQPPIHLRRTFGDGRRCPGGAQIPAPAPPSAVAPRPTRWRDASVGGRRVHEVRFRREGEPAAEKDRA